MTTPRKTRVFPSCCTSAFCGGFGDDCTACPHKPTKDAFKAWVKEHAAVVEDDIWCPTVYTATK